jgi:hypothetical protein
MMLGSGFVPWFVLLAFAQSIDTASASKGASRTDSRCTAGKVVVAGGPLEVQLSVREHRWRPRAEAGITLTLERPSGDGLSLVSPELLLEASDPRPEFQSKFLSQPLDPERPLPPLKRTAFEVGTGGATVLKIAEPDEIQWTGWYWSALAFLDLRSAAGVGRFRLWAELKVMTGSERAAWPCVASNEVEIEIVP